MKHSAILSVATFVAAMAVSQFCEAAPGDLYAIKPLPGGINSEIVKFNSNGAEMSFVASTGASIPGQLAFDKTGNLFLPDRGSSEIVRFAPSGGQTVFVMNVVAAGLAFDKSGNPYASEPGGHDVLKFTPAGIRSTFASGLSQPYGIAFDSVGTLFVADAGAGAVLKVTPAGAVSNFASGFATPTGVAFDKAGNLFVTDNTTIWKVNVSGDKTMFASGLSGPASPAFDSSGNLFVIVASGILKFTPSATQNAFASGDFTTLAFEPILEKLRNVSARGLVGTGDNVLIGGFILGGNALANNAIVVRALGPSLTSSGVGNALADPIVELYNADGVLIETNDDWQDTQAAQITAEGLAPPDPRESAIFASLPAGNYTAVVHGHGSASGVALVEVYSR